MPKFCFYEIINSMSRFTETGSVNSAALVEHLESEFDVEVEDEGFLEDTFIGFIKNHCG